METIVPIDPDKDAASAIGDRARRAAQTLFQANPDLSHVKVKQIAEDRAATDEIHYHEAFAPDAHRSLYFLIFTTTYRLARNLARVTADTKRQLRDLHTNGWNL